MPELSGKTIGFLVANEGIEQIELEAPWKAVQEAGGRAVLIAPKAGTVQAFNHLDKGDKFDVHQVVAQADPAEFDGLVLPGGVANPDALRTDEDAVSFVQSYAATGRPIAAICHAPWTLVEAGLTQDRTLTSWPSLKTDIRNSGGEWVDQQVVVDRDGPFELVTSRNPDDLPAFNKAAISAFQRSTH